MSELFHKSCYTSRSYGYKYRSSATNTGDTKRRSGGKDDVIIDKKFRELRKAISSRINDQVDQTQRSRETIKEKLLKVESKINSMLELKDTMAGLQQDLRKAEGTLVSLIGKVEKIEERFSLKTEKSSFEETRRFRETEIFGPNVTLV